MDYGRTGVQLFFVLSGFLLFLPYARWLFALGPRPSARLFYRRRLLRVGPAYWVNLLVLVALAPLGWSLLASALAHVVYLQNVFFNSSQKINSVYWTMAVEVQFYLVLPAIGWTITALARRGIAPVRAAMLVLGSLMLVSVICDTLNARTALSGVPIVSTALIDSYALPYWLGVFAAGMACSVLYVYLTQVRPLDANALRRVRVRAGAIFAGGLIVGVSVAVVPWLHHLPLKDQIYGWVYGAVLLGVLIGPAPLRRPFASRALRFVGWISYSLYLWHLPILLALEPHLGEFASLPTRTLAGFVLDLLIAVPTAYLSFQLTERPFLRARRRAHDVAVGEPAGAPVDAAPMPALVGISSSAAQAEPV
jgi:peptidoglycan/LPS O-acetylase OafA/YrhL